MLGIAQDKNGFLWFGTQDGLNRYDGYSFKVYKHKPGVATSLSDNFVKALWVDVDGGLWVGTRNGLNLFRQEKDDFERFRFDEKNENGISANNIQSIFQDSKNRLWIGFAGGGIDRYDKGNGKFSSIKVFNDENLEGLEVWSIDEDSNSRICIGTKNHGIFIFNENSSRFESFSTGTDLGRVYFAKFDSNDQLWISYFQNGLAHIVDNQIKLFEKGDSELGLSSSSAKNLLSRKDGSIWVGTEHGLNIINNGVVVAKYLYDESNDSSLVNNNIRSLFEDRTGTVWVGAFNGLNKIDLNSSFNQKKLGGGSKPYYYINSIFETSDDSVWVGTQRGAALIDRDSVVQERYFNEPGDSSSLISNNVLSFGEDYKGNLWIGTGKGVSVFDKKEKSFQSFSNKPEITTSLGKGAVWSIVSLPGGELLFGIFGSGLYILKKHELDKFLSSGDTRLVFERPFTGKKTNGLVDGYVVFMHLTKDLKLLVGTYRNGLYLIDNYNESLWNYKNLREVPGNGFSLSSNVCLSVYENPAGDLWIGTSGGLNFLSKNEMVNGSFNFICYRESDGLPNEVINGVLGDKNGNVWMSTNNGISKFNPKARTFKNYDLRDGLQDNEFNTGAYFQSKDGQFFFGGINGFNAFYPQDIQDDPHKPPVVVTDLLIFNKPALLRRDDPKSPLNTAISETSQLNLSYKHSVFSFKFAALHYAIPEKNQYAYKMENYYDDWIETGADNRMATFTNLDPGDYVFRVKGSNKDGNWNEAGASINIHISAPFYATWWAYAIYFLMIMALLYWYLNIQRSRLEQERSVSHRLRELDRMKDEFLANTSHELRTPLNGIIGLTESIVAGAGGKLNEKIKTDLSLVVASGKRLAHLVNEILDFAKLKNHGLTLRKRPVDLSSLTEVVLALSTPLIGFKDLKLINQIADDLPLVEADEDRLQQILYNLIGNAIKFTEQGEIRITAEEREGQILVGVSDTGIGIRKEDLGRIFRSFEQVEGNDTRQYSGTGIGLALTRQLVLLHGGMIHVESQIGLGSTFTFTLPKADSDAVFVSAPPSQPITRLRAEAQILTENNLLPGSPLNLNDTQIAASEAVTDDQDYSAQGFVVLIVDDEPVNCRVLTNYLTLEKYGLLVAESGFQALDIIESGERVDLVLLDVMMPRMSGYEVCRKLREKFTVHELPIIFLTAKDQVSDLVTGFALGANDFVTKPISRNELLSRVKTHLKLLDANRNLEEKVEARTGELKQKNEEILMTQQQMVMQEKMASLGILTAGVAHEINNPTNFAHVSAQNMEVDLEAFRAFLMELAEDAGDTLLHTFEGKFSLLFGHLGTVLEGTNRIKQIVRDLRVFSRLDESESKPVHIADSLQSTLNLVKTKYRETTSFVCDFKENPELVCWPAQLNQVFMNLIVNACQAIQSKNKAEGRKGPGELKITTEINGAWVVIRFIDSGCGIPDDVRDKIFEPFFTTKDVGEGTGLGLSISYGIIQKHKGRMEVDSVPGEGTTFTLHLPLTGETLQEEPKDGRI